MSATTPAEAKLNDLAAAIELDMASLKNGDQERRKIIIRIGKRLLDAKKQCKVDGVAWADWVQYVSLGSHFGGVRNTYRYMAIAQYPCVFKGDMSIKEGAKICRYAKTHGGELPMVEWKGGRNRRLITLQVKLGRSMSAIDKMLEQGPKLETLRREEKWTRDEVLGTVETLKRLMAEAAALLNAIDPSGNP